MLFLLPVVLCKSAVAKAVHTTAKWRGQTTRANCRGRARARNFFPNLFAHSLPAERISRLTFKADEEGAGQKGRKESREPIRVLTSTIKFLETYRDRNYRSVRSEIRWRKLRRSCSERPGPFKISTLYSRGVLSRSLMILSTHE